MQASLLFTLALASLASASPISSRQQSSLQCSRAKPAKLYLQSTDGKDLVPVALTNYQITDSFGNYSSVLVTKALDGSAVAPTKFDFAACSSTNAQIQTQPSQVAGHISSYGENGPPHRCLSSSKSESNESIFTNSVCPTSDGDERQLQSFFEWNALDQAKNSEAGSASRVEFIGSKSYQEQVLTISGKEGEHGAVKLWNSVADAPKGEKTFTFALVPQ